MMIYVSGKITGDKNYKQKFEKAANIYFNNLGAPAPILRSDEEYQQIMQQMQQQQQEASEKQETQQNLDQ